MQVDKDLVSKLVQGKKASELLSETKDKLVTDVVTASQNVLSQVKACLAINDIDGAKVLLSVESQEEEEDKIELSSKEDSKEVEEAEEESGEDEDKTELSKESQEESKIELSAIHSFANSIEADLTSIDTDIAAIKDRDVSRKLGAKLQSMFDKVLQIKGDK